MDTVDVLQFKFLSLDTTMENKAVIIKRLRYLETLSTSSTEYQKNLNWLREALSFPYNKVIKMPVVIKSSSSKQVADYVTEVYQKLDDYIYGMQDVKEELMSFVCKRISNPESGDHVLALSGANGVGKCFAIDTEILMYNGDKKKVQDVIPGDLLMGDNSTPRRVLTLGSGHDDLYKITHTTSGDSYTVNGDHILCLKSSSKPNLQHSETNSLYQVRMFTENGKTKSHKYCYKSIRTQTEALQLATEKLHEFSNIDSTYEIPVSTLLSFPEKAQKMFKGYIVGVDFPFRKISIDPYLLGAWLGDGSSKGTMFTNQDAVILKYIHTTLLNFNCHLQYRSQYDYYIVGISYKNNKGKNPFLECLKQYDLVKNKHIPNEYLVNSREIRLQLLAGILDTDGSLLACKTGFEIIQKSERLARDIRELCTSLGFNAQLKTCQKTCTNNGKVGTYYRMFIYGGCEVIPTKCRRKRAQPRRQEKDALVSALKIEKVGKGNYYGFTIDGNERFVLGNYIVTHNTRFAHGLARALDLPIRTINLGSVNDVSYFTGHAFTYVDSCPGKIIQILNETQCKNCIIYFDELDKIHRTDKGQAIYAFLTHLIDPSQNKKFQDLYLSGLEFDVSKVFFVFSYNDVDSIDKTVKDRLKIINIKEPSHDDKVQIAEKFIISEICENINYDVKIDRDIIEEIVRQDQNRSGLRGIRRVLEDIICKLNVIRLLDDSWRDRLSFYDNSSTRMIHNIIKQHKTEDGRHEHMYS